MSSMLPPSRKKRPVEYLLWGVAVVAGLVVIYVAIQAVLAPWTKTTLSPPGATLTPMPDSASTVITSGHNGHTPRQIPSSTGRFDADLAQPLPTEDQLKRQLDHESRRLDADMQYEKAQRVAAAKAKLQALLDKGQEVLRLIDTLQSEVDRWNTTTSALLTNDEGKLVAGSRGQLEEFDALSKEDRPSRDSVLAIRRRIDDLTQPIAQAVRAQECTAQPSREVVALLDDARAQATTMLGTCRDHCTRLDSLVARAKTAGTPTTATLRKSLDELHDSYAAQRNATIARAIQEQRQRDAEKMAEVERKKVEQEEESRRRQAEKERLIAFARDQNVQRAFLPFLEKGQTRITKHPDYRGYQFSSVRGASELLSYSALARIDALTDFDMFLRVATGRPITVGSSYCQGGVNDRPLWPYPKSERDWVTCRKNFEYFKQLAPIWLELGMLDP